jgi:XTP/dITP diphosphohydrolase
MNDVRAAEKVIAAARRGDQVPEELDVAVLDSITEEEWRAAWPVGTEPAPEHVPEPSPELVAEDEAPPEQPVIEEEFPAEQLPVLSDLDAATNGQPDGVEPSVDHSQE